MIFAQIPLYLIGGFVVVSLPLMYFNSITDSLGFIHSIDNCVLNYYMYSSVDSVLKIIKEKGGHRDTYWEKLNCASCPKWSFYQNHIHYDEGIYLKIGHYSDYDREKKMYRLLPMFSLEVNPNKHYEKESYKEILEFIKIHCNSGDLVRVDYAIDIPLALDDIQIFKTRKEKGLYKGTRYFGQRNQNGFCKIYDKGKEIGEERNLTRVEHTLVLSKKLSLEKFCYRDNSVNDKELESLSGVLQSLVFACLEIKSLGGDYSKCLEKIERHTRYKIEPFLSGGYSEYVYDTSILEKLLKRIKEEFFIEDSFYEDEDGFLHFIGECPFDF